MQRLETPEVIPSISPFPPPPERDHMKEMRDSWDPRYVGISEHLAPMQGHSLQITTCMTHWWQGDFPYPSSIWWKAVFGRRVPLNVTSKVHLNFLLTLAQSQAFSWSKAVLFINPNQMNSFLDYSFWHLQETPLYLRLRWMQVKTIWSSQISPTPTSSLTNPNIFVYPAQLL